MCAVRYIHQEVLFGHLIRLNFECKSQLSAVAELAGGNQSSSLAGPLESACELWVFRSEPSEEAEEQGVNCPKSPVQKTGEAHSEEVNSIFKENPVCKMLWLMMCSCQEAAHCDKHCSSLH